MIQYQRHCAAGRCGEMEVLLAEVRCAHTSRLLV